MYQELEPQSAATRRVEDVGAICFLAAFAVSCVFGIMMLNATVRGTLGEFFEARAVVLSITVLIFMLNAVSAAILTRTIPPKHLPKKPEETFGGIFRFQMFFIAAAFAAGFLLTIPVLIAVVVGILIELYKLLKAVVTRLRKSAWEIWHELVDKLPSICVFLLFVKGGTFVVDATIDLSNAPQHLQYLANLPYGFTAASLGIAWVITFAINLAVSGQTPGTTDPRNYLDRSE